MRSLIILEVEHGEGTDSFQKLIDHINTSPYVPGGMEDIQVLNYTVRVDLPECFVLDSDS